MPEATASTAYVKQSVECVMNKLTLPERTSKPRAEGLTAITDTGLPTVELQGILEDFHEFLDIAKLGVGSAYVTPTLGEKLELYRSYNVVPYFGGTLFEKFYHQNCLEDYLDYLAHWNVDWIEVSTGTIDITLEARVELVQRLCQDFTVLCEVGSKDKDAIMPPSKWIQEMSTLLEAGCRYVITEGRDSGTAGVYRPSGEIRTGLVSDIIHTIDTQKIIFEAPKPSSQMFFINHVGANVNLGNVSARDLVLLETQRQALRYETFHLT